MRIPFVPFVGLMGLGNDNMLYTPKGNRICKVPGWLSWRVQHTKHTIAQLTWRQQ